WCIQGQEARLGSNSRIRGRAEVLGVARPMSLWRTAQYAPRQYIPLAQAVAGLIRGQYTTPCLAAYPILGSMQLEMFRLAAYPPCIREKTLAGSLGLRRR